MSYPLLWMIRNKLIIPDGIGLTFDQIAQAIGKNEVWLAAAFYGQVRNFHSGKYFKIYRSRYEGQIYQGRTR